jgi:hypothetical protein
MAHGGGWVLDVLGLKKMFDHLETGDWRCELEMRILEMRGFHRAPRPLAKKDGLLMEI